MPEDIEKDAAQNAAAAPGAPSGPEGGEIGKTTLGEGGSNKIAYLMVGLLVILVAAIAIFVWSTAAVKSKLADSTQMKIADVNKELQSRADAEKKSVAVKVAVDNIPGTLSTQKIWSKLLTTISRQTLKSVRLTEISTDNKGVISIRGLTKSHFEVARMASSIREDSSFKNVVIDKSTYSAVQGSSLTIDFSIKAELTGGALKQVTENSSSSKE